LKGRDFENGYYWVKRNNCDGIVHIGNRSPLDFDDYFVEKITKGNETIHLSGSVKLPFPRDQIFYHGHHKLFFQGVKKGHNDIYCFVNEKDTLEQFHKNVFEAEIYTEEYYNSKVKEAKTCFNPKVKINDLYGGSKSIILDNSNEALFPFKFNQLFYLDAKNTSKKFDKSDKKLTILLKGRDKYNSLYWHIEGDNGVSFWSMIETIDDVVKKGFEITDDI
jgi:hypothetical protein